MLALRGRVALVTGSTRGLGRAIARTLVERGASVLVSGRDEAHAHEVAVDLDPSGHRAQAVGLDVRSRTSFAAAIEEARLRFGRLDILVNNAGATASRPFFELEDAEWDEVMATNLRSVMIGCQLAGPLMREQQYGRIVNHASLAGQQGGTVTGAHYAASKAGIIVLTKIIARELAPYSVTVNAIAPAAVESPVMDELPREQIDRLRSLIPVGRLGRPEEIAALVAFLASEDAGYITGATLDINGGLLMR